MTTKTTPGDPLASLPADTADEVRAVRSILEAVERLESMIVESGLLPWQEYEDYLERKNP